MNGVGERGANTAVTETSGSKFPVVAFLLIATLIFSVGPLIPVAFIRAPVVLPAALIAPGYALVVAAFGRRRFTDLAPVAALSVLLSLAIYPLVVLALSFLSIRISARTVIIGMDIVMAALLLCIVLRDRMHLPVAAELELPADGGFRAPAWSGLPTVLLFLVIVMASVEIVRVAPRVLPGPIPQPYTQFYLRGNWAHVAGPVYAASGRPLTVKLGISNQTHQRQTYRIVPVLSAGARWPVHQVAVSPGKIWSGTLAGISPRENCLTRLRILLYRGRDARPMSSLVLWLESTRVLPSVCTSVGGR